MRSIGESAFENNRLERAAIPGSVSEIGNYAFAGNRLESITIPGSVASIGSDAFAGNPLTEITVEGGETEIELGGLWPDCRWEAFAEFYSQSPAPGVYLWDGAGWNFQGM